MTEINDITIIDNRDNGARGFCVRNLVVILIHQQSF